MIAKNFGGCEAWHGNSPLILYLATFSHESLRGLHAGDSFCLFPGQLHTVNHFSYMKESSHIPVALLGNYQGFPPEQC